MKILFDAMGGDNAPHANIKGAVKYAKETESEIILIGHKHKLNQASNEIYGKKIEDLASNLKIHHTEDEIIMEDIPTEAIRKKKDSSMVVGLNMLKEGNGDVFISAGNTGALLTGATLLVGRIKGIIRPALAGLMPGSDGSFLLIDCGANTNARAENFLQFAKMGSMYLQYVENVENPKIGLLNIGTEENKGNDIYKEAYMEFKERGHEYDLNFKGNIEPRDVFFHHVDVVVADGFTGNILIKTMEGVGKLIRDKMLEMVTENTWSKLSAIPMYGKFKKFRSEIDYKKYGGAIFLGIKKPIVKSHGNSDEKSFYYTLKQSEDFAKSRFTEHMTEYMENKQDKEKNK